jgi:hypothetical protein
MTYTESAQAQPARTVTAAAPPDNLDAFRAAAEQLGARRGEADWTRELRRAALEAYREQPFPNRGMELWRRTDFGSLPLGSLAPSADGTPARNVDDLPVGVLARLHGEDSHAGVVVQRNSAVSLEQSLASFLGQLVQLHLDRRQAFDRVLEMGSGEVGRSAVPAVDIVVRTVSQGFPSSATSAVQRV